MGAIVGDDGGGTGVACNGDNLWMPPPDGTVVMSALNGAIGVENVSSIGVLCEIATGSMELEDVL